jgi:hypothetical protein
MSSEYLLDDVCGAGKEQRHEYQKTIEFVLSL